MAWKKISDKHLHRVGYIYKIENIYTGKIYIGKSSNYKLRWKTHIEQLEKGKHHNYKLQQDYTKYKRNGFSFIVIKELFNVTERQLLDFEMVHIELYKKKGAIYNIVTADTKFPMTKKRVVKKQQSTFSLDLDINNII